MDKGQIIRYSKNELNLLKSTFADNTKLLTALYKFMLQLELTEAEDVMIRKLNTPDVLVVLRKQFIPNLNDDCPIEQRIDLFMTVKTEDTDTDDVWISANARETVVDYLEQRLTVLEGETPDKEIKLDDLKNIKGEMEGVNMINYHIGLKARNTVINHVIQRVMEIKTLAGTKDETPEERDKRLLQNSNR